MKAWPGRSEVARGHSSVQITLDRYSHVMPRLTAALADRIDAAYRDAEPAPSSSVAQRATTVLLRDGLES
jgi:hypothetical protein